jgi:Second Messenger Oligonucleotide or Dinucleotide Synthetase domain
MAKDIPDSFRIFQSNLEVSDLLHSKISSRQLLIRGALEEEMHVLHTFLSGSYSRNTMISPLYESDIDMFAVLDPSHYTENGQIDLLDQIKRVLHKTCVKAPQMHKNGHAVNLTFSDFTVNVIPAFQKDGGGYIIPDTIENKWISTDPRLHVDLISDADSRHGGNLIPLIKMIKGWNRTANRPLRPFHLEVMAYQLFKNMAIKSYPSALLYFFGEGRHYIRKQNLDPAGYGEDIGGYIKTRQKMEEAESGFETAYTRAYRAVYYREKAQAENSINEWRKIFGNYFPAYG